MQASPNIVQQVFNFRPDFLVIFLLYPLCLVLVARGLSSVGLVVDSLVRLIVGRMRLVVGIHVVVVVGERLLGDAGRGWRRILAG
jgi:hypothetical protein